MNELEKQIKETIISRYGSLKSFCEAIDMPWSTLNSILNRGFANSNIVNVLKVAQELDIDTEPLAFGIIRKRTPSSLASPQLTAQENRVLAVFRRLGDVDQEKLIAYGEGLAAAGADDAEREVDRIVAQELAAAKESKVSMK